MYILYMYMTLLVVTDPFRFPILGPDNYSSSISGERDIVSEM